MKRPSKLVAIAIVASISFGTASYADSVSANWLSKLEGTIAVFNNDFDVEFSNEFNRQYEQKNPYATPLPDDGVAKLQAAIRGNKSLTERLEATGIKVDSIVNAHEDGDGNLTFYARRDMR